jgi:hypothetical protein
VVGHKSKLRQIGLLRQRQSRCLPPRLYAGRLRQRLEHRRVRLGRRRSEVPIPLAHQPPEQSATSAESIALEQPSELVPGTARCAASVRRAHSRLSAGRISAHFEAARLPAPTVGKTVNIEPVKGQVFVSVPGDNANASASVPGLKGRKFVPLGEARQIFKSMQLDDQALGVPGQWEVEVDARVSAFDTYSADTEIKHQRK